MASQYLRRDYAQALNPTHLPLQQAVFTLPERRLRDGDAMPLTFKDALSDSWGRKVLEAQQGHAVTDAEALLLTNADRVGAMVFSATLPILSGEPESELFVLEDLALGGARHIAKFAARGDDHDVAVLKTSTLALARECGIAVPPFFVHPVPTGHALVLQRFHYLSASALLNVA